MGPDRSLHHLEKRPHQVPVVLWAFRSHSSGGIDLSGFVK